MAIIGDIRKRSGLLVGAIALSIFLFLLGDAVNNQFSVLSKGKGNDAGTVDGETITYQDYSNQVNENVKNVEAQYKTSIVDAQRNAINKQTWDDMVNKIVMDDASAKTGVVVSDDELVSLTTSDNPHPMIRQPFGGEQYNPMYVKQFLQNIDIDDKGQEPGYKRRAWNQLVKDVKKAQLQTKYSLLVAKGVGDVPTWMAEDLYYEAAKTADFKYVMLPYSEVNDNDIKYTDNDLKEYLDKNAGKFVSPDETRNIRYVAFDIVASPIDSLAALKSLTDRLEEFKKGENKSDDSLFVKLYSETPFDDTYKTKDQLIGNYMADSAFSLPLRAVVGPYVEGGFYKFAKISAKKMLSDSVRVREITFAFGNVKTEAEQKAKVALADSIFKAIDSLHADFGAMATAYSDDPAAKATGGDIGWVKFADPTKDELYKNIVFQNGVPGKPYRYFDGQSVLKFIEIVQEAPSKPGVKIAYYTRSIVPSEETEKNIYSNVTQFVSTTSNEEKFKAYMKAHEREVKTAINITKESYDVMGLGSARSLVKWVFNAKRGDVSPIISLGTSNDRKHIVAYLESVTGKGKPDLESVRERVKALYLQEKKFELLAKKITDANATTIDALATKLGKPVLEADRISFLNNNLPTGNEPAVAATGVYLAQGKLSAPIKGNSGAYVVQKISGVDPPKPTDLTQQDMMLKQGSYMKARNAPDVLRKLAKVDDNRLYFEGGN
jgi:peptidyl-prolyl cis-trans isomerase D